jgi:hypothetical protein
MRIVGARKKTCLLEKRYRYTKADDDDKLWRIQFKHQREFFKHKLKGYWTSEIDACRGDSKALWSKLRLQMSSPLQENSSHFSADEFAAFFTSKVEKIRASTSSAPPPVITTRPVATPFSSFEPVSVDEVTRLLSRTPAKHCLLDPAPT